MSQGVFYWTSGTLQTAVDDGYFANLYNYREYMPNYLWEIITRSVNNINLKPTVFTRMSMGKHVRSL
jgi:hypothetical protein